MINFITNLSYLWWVCYSIVEVSTRFCWFPCVVPNKSNPQGVFCLQHIFTNTSCWSSNPVKKSHNNIYLIIWRKQNFTTTVNSYFGKYWQPLFPVEIPYTFYSHPWIGTSQTNVKRTICFDLEMRCPARHDVMRGQYSILLYLPSITSYIPKFTDYTNVLIQSAFDNLVVQRFWRREYGIVRCN